MTALPTGAPLRLFNSMSRAIEPFRPIDPARVRIYSCGPTVYNFSHLGNLRAYVFTDTISRTLQAKGYRVTHVINITDVGHLTSDADAGEDKMELAAAGLGKDIWEVAAFYTQAFKRNLADLNILDPTRWSVATDHIAEMIAFAARIAPAHCYEIESGLYFDVTTVPDYGLLARAHGDEGEGRIDPVSGKRHPQDFAIWRKSPPGETRQMEWPSPWGRGAPGWHLECSVMSHKYLVEPFGGQPFDIHTGGIDHREIHHPNEIAQNQAFCACADSGAHFWMHNNFLVDRAGKMSKSGGGFTILPSLVERGIHPLAYRLLCLSAHYRSELEFSAEAIGAALTRLKRLVLAVAMPGAAKAGPVEGAAPYLASLDEALSDDLNTPRALVALDELLADRRLAADDRRAALASFDATLGLDLLRLARADLRITPADATLTPDEIDARLDERQQARAAKDFARSDAIRDTLIAQDVEVMDGDPLRWEWRLSL